MAAFRATLTYPDYSTTGIWVRLPDGATRPPVRLRLPADVDGVLEVFELVDDEDWDTEHLAGYVFTGTTEKSPGSTP